MSKTQDGVGLSSSIKVGMFLSRIISEIKELESPIEQSLMLHNLYESSKFSDKKWTNKAINDNLQNLRSTITPRIKRINEQIDSANKIIKLLDFKQVIPKIGVNDVMGTVRMRLRAIFEVEDAQNMSNEHFRMSLSKTLQKPPTAIMEFLDVIDRERHIAEVKGLSETYKGGMEQAINVCSAGYYSTSVFIAGKTMEEVVNAYFEELFRLGKCERFKLTDIKLEKKIGKLHGSKYIDEDLFHKLSNIRIDRNEFGHPSKKLLSKRQAYLRIQFIAEVLPELEKKIKRLKAKKV